MAWKSKTKTAQYVDSKGKTRTVKEKVHSPEAEAEFNSRVRLQASNGNRVHITETDHRDEHGRRVY